MAYTANDGREFSMSSRMRAHNKSLKATSTKLPGSILDSPEDHDEPAAQHDPSEVVAEHGPARHLQVEHNEEQGQHQVHSVHEDGHKHHSVHASRAEAHDAARELAAADQGPEPEGDDYAPEDEEGL